MVRRTVRDRAADRAAPFLRGAWVAPRGDRVERAVVARDAGVRREVAARVREDDPREADVRVGDVFRVFADAFFCVGGAAIGAQSVV